MKIRELHSDIERYLEHDCYCPNEIYGTDGFGYRLHYADDECEKLVETNNFIACITEYAFGEKVDKPMMLVFFIDREDSGYIFDAVSYDATENNVSGLLNYVKTGKKFTEDYFNKDWNKGMKEILSMCNMVMID